MKEYTVASVPFNHRCEYCGTAFAAMVGGYAAGWVGLSRMQATAEARSGATQDIKKYACPACGKLHKSTVRFTRILLAGLIYFVPFLALLSMLPLFVQGHITGGLALGGIVAVLYVLFRILLPGGWDINAPGLAFERQDERWKHEHQTLEKPPDPVASAFLLWYFVAVVASWIAFLAVASQLWPVHFVAIAAGCFVALRLKREMYPPTPDPPFRLTP